MYHISFYHASALFEGFNKFSPSKDADGKPTKTKVEKPWTKHLIQRNCLCDVLKSIQNVGLFPKPNSKAADIVKGLNNFIHFLANPNERQARDKCGKMARWIAATIDKPLDSTVKLKNETPRILMALCDTACIQKDWKFKSLLPVQYLAHVVWIKLNNHFLRQLYPIGWCVDNNTSRSKSESTRTIPCVQKKIDPNGKIGSIDYFTQVKVGIVRLTPKDGLEPGKKVEVLQTFEFFSAATSDYDERMVTQNRNLLVAVEKVRQPSPPDILLTLEMNNQTTSPPKAIKKSRTPKRASKKQEPTSPVKEVLPPGVDAQDCNSSSDDEDVIIPVKMTKTELQKIEILKSIPENFDFKPPVEEFTDPLANGDKVEFYQNLLQYYNIATVGKWLQKQDADRLKQLSTPKLNVVDLAERLKEYKVKTSKKRIEELIQLAKAMATPSRSRRNNRNPIDNMTPGDVRLNATRVGKLPLPDILVQLDEPDVDRIKEEVIEHCSHMTARLNQMDDLNGAADNIVESMNSLIAANLSLDPQQSIDLRTKAIQSIAIFDKMNTIKYGLREGIKQACNTFDITPDEVHPPNEKVKSNRLSQTELNSIISKWKAPSDALDNIKLELANLQITHMHVYRLSLLIEQMGWSRNMAITVNVAEIQDKIIVFKYARPGPLLQIYKQPNLKKGVNNEDRTLAKLLRQYEAGGWVSSLSINSNSESDTICLCWKDMHSFATSLEDVTSVEASATKPCDDDDEDYNPSGDASDDESNQDEEMSVTSAAQASKPPPEQVEASVQDENEGSDTVMQGPSTPDINSKKRKAGQSPPASASSNSSRTRRGASKKTKTASDSSPATSVGPRRSTRSAEKAANKTAGK